MRYLLINGSPKAGSSTSMHVLSYLKERLGEAAEVYHTGSGAALPDTANATCIIFALPLYVDSLPGHFLSYLAELQETVQKNTPGIPIYAVLNCGFFEAEQNHVALRILQNWCSRAGARWGQGILIGGGGMVEAAPIGKGPLSKIGSALSALLVNIEKLRTAATCQTHPSIPRWLYIAAAHYGWRKEGRQNGLNNHDLKNGISSGIGPFSQ